jgi:Transmembrane domain of unknown function (DUF3566)
MRRSHLGPVTYVRRNLDVFGPRRAYPYSSIAQGRIAIENPMPNDDALERRGPEAAGFPAASAGPVMTPAGSTGVDEPPDAPRAPAFPPTGTPPPPGAVPRSSRSMTPPKKATRRTQVVIRRVGPWSVLKFSLIFYFCVMLILFFALLMIYLVLSAAGSIDSLEKVLGYVFGNGTSTRGPTPVNIDGRQVFTWIFFAGLVFTVVWSLINVFVAFLYNLISDILGGIEVTLAEKPR